MAYLRGMPGWAGERLAVVVGPSERKAILVKTLVAGLVVLMFVGTANADFSNVFAPANWTLNNPAGGVVVQFDASLMHLLSGSADTSGVTEYSITITADDTLTVDWEFYAWDMAGMDWCYYSLNGAKNELADDSGSPDSFSLPVSAGDVFALGVETIDGWFGSGEFWVTDFQFTAPEPSSLWMLLLGMFGLGVRRSRQR